MPKNPGLIPSPRRADGFTLIELLVVVIIIGILVAVAVPKYTKTVESSRADDALSLVQMIGTANRMYALDHAGAYLSGAVTNGCNDGSTACPHATPVCGLISCRYLAGQDFDGRTYSCRAVANAAVDDCGLGATAVKYVACCKREAGPGGVYEGWGYTMDTNGAVNAWGTDVPQPPA